MHINLRKLAECRNAREAIEAGLIHCGFEFEFHNFKELAEVTEVAPARPLLPQYKQELRAMDYFFTHGGVIGIDTVTFNGNDYSSPEEVFAAILIAHPELRHAEQRTSEPDGEGFSAVKRSSLYPILSSHKMELGSDNSVRGGEIRTLGPLTPQAFLKAAKVLFEAKNKWTVDEGCSFHIHLSVPDVKHGYGTQTQYRLMEGIALSAGRVPKGVLSRWKSERNYTYYKVQLSREKYSFVHQHEECNTWEFRCWGNVKTYKEAIQCLILSIEAMIHASYARLHKLPAVQFRPMDVPEWVRNYAQEGDGSDDGDDLAYLWSALVGETEPVMEHKGVV